MTSRPPVGRKQVAEFMSRPRPGQPAVDRCDPRGCRNHCADHPRACPDCGVEPGWAHRRGCDVERCSRCGQQYITCGCGNHSPQFSRWTGFWPGELEAAALGISLNDLVMSRWLRRAFFVEPIGLRGASK